MFIGHRPSSVPPKSHDAWQTSSREAPRIAAESGGPRETLVLICAGLLSSPRWRRRSITATICRSTRLSVHSGTKQPEQRSTAGEDAPPPRRRWTLLLRGHLTGASAGGGKHGAKPTAGEPEYLEELEDENLICAERSRDRLSPPPAVCPCRYVLVS